MIGLIIVTHGNLAREFVAALEHVVGPQQQIAAISIAPNDDMEERRNAIIAAVKKVEQRRRRYYSDRYVWRDAFKSGNIGHGQRVGGGHRGRQSPHARQTGARPRGGRVSRRFEASAGSGPEIHPRRELGSERAVTRMVPACRCPFDRASQAADGRLSRRLTESISASPR